MPIEDILSKIEEETVNKIEQILSKAREERSKILMEAEREIAREREERIKKAERELEKKKRAEIAKIVQGARREILQLKERIINECLERALQKLKDLEEKDYERIIEDLMRSVIGEIGKDCIITPSREEDKRIAIKLGLEIENKKIDSIGGFIARSKDGSITIDNRFESILDRKEREIRIKIGNILFGGE